jgi:hypothetical protein
VRVSFTNATFFGYELTLTHLSLITVHSTDEPDGVPDVEEEEIAQGQPEDDVIEETMFTFESYELVRGLR